MNIFSKPSKKKKKSRYPHVASSSSRSASFEKNQSTLPFRAGERSHKSNSFPTKSSRDSGRPTSPSCSIESKVNNLDPGELTVENMVDPMEVDHDLGNLASTPANSFHSNFSKSNGHHGISPPKPPPHNVTKSPPLKRTSSIDAEAFKLAGNKLFKSKNYEQAVKEYSKAIDADSKNATYWSNRAAAYISACCYSLALEDSRTAASIDPSPKILLRLARCYVSLGRPTEALDVFARIQPRPSQSDMQPAVTMKQHLQRAENAVNEKKHGSIAISSLDQAEHGLGSGVGRPRKWKLLRVEAYLQIGSPESLEEAHQVVTSMLSHNERDPEAFFLRGKIFYALGENKIAISRFREALNLDPEFKDARLCLRMTDKLHQMKEDGNSQFNAKLYNEAAAIYTKALEIDPSNKVTNAKLLQNRAKCYVLLKKNYDLAVADCTQALELTPTYIKARMTKAKALGELGNWEEAVREYKKVHETSPSEAGIAKEIRNAEMELKKSKRKDYYKLLGVSKTATDAEIKKAYRNMAKVHHPDKNPNCKESVEKFKDISEAYEKLSNPQERARYDSGADLMDASDMYPGAGMGGFGGAVNISPEVLYSMMSSGGAGSHFFRSSGGNPFRQGMGGERSGRSPFPQGFPF